MTFSGKSDLWWYQKSQKGRASPALGKSLFWKNHKGGFRLSPACLGLSTTAHLQINLLCLEFYLNILHFGGRWCLIYFSGKSILEISTGEFWNEWPTCLFSDFKSKREKKISLQIILKWLSAWFLLNFLRSNIVYSF